MARADLIGLAAGASAAALGGAATVATAIGDAATGSGADVGALISAGGSFSAAGALIYIVKQMTDGKLVARDPGRVEATQAEQIARHQVLLTESLERERKWETFALSRLTKDQP